MRTSGRFGAVEFIRKKNRGLISADLAQLALIHERLRRGFLEVDYLTENQLNLRLPQAKLVAYQHQRLLDR